VPVPVFSASGILAAITPEAALEAVRAAFVEHARGAWQMPSKVYVEAPDGDFRAMPAAGGGYAVLKWVTSYPGNPARGLPTVSGVVILSDAVTGEPLALLDAASVTALRTGAAAVLAAETLGAAGEGPAAVVGCGVNGRAVAATLAARGFEVLLFDVSAERAHAVAGELGSSAQVAGDLAAALACGVVVTVTPGSTPLIREGMLRAGQHVSLMGADGPGKHEIEAGELLRCRIVCDEWAQASHNGDVSALAAGGGLTRDGVAELGQVLLGTEPGRRSAEEITVFDSTGLAVQDLALAIAVYERYRADPNAFPDLVQAPLGWARGA